MVSRFFKWLLRSIRHLVLRLRGRSVDLSGSQQDAPIEASTISQKPTAAETSEQQASTHQSVVGNDNQVIAKMTGGTVIKNQTILPTPAPSVVGVPNNLQERGSTTFVGRDQTLKELHEKLQASHTLAITALQGMGGIGKTELAVQYAQQYKSHYPSGICWLSARGAEVGTQIVKFAVDALGLPQPEGELDAQLQFVWSHWPKQAKGDRVLLIYDDVADEIGEDTQQKIAAYDTIKAALPVDSRFQVLLTTRLRNVAATVDDFQIELLSEAAALELLEVIVGKTRIDSERETAQALCERVGYLPLGLELLGYFLTNKPDMTLSRQEQRLEKKKLEAKAFEKAHPGMTAKLGVYEAFELSWGELSGDGQRLACWLSLFALAPMPWELVAAATVTDEREDLEDTRDYELLKLSLLQRLEAESYQLHQLVREFFLAKLNEREDSDELKVNYCGLMVERAKQIDQSATQEVTQATTLVVPHVAEVINSWSDSLSDEDFFWPFSGLTFFYYAQGIYGVAVGWAAQAAISTKERFGEQHPSVASSLNNLAVLYESQGRYEAAEPLYLEALELLKQLLGEQHPDVATSLNNLALLYQAQGRYETAENFMQQALQIKEKLLGQGHPEFAISLWSLANLYTSTERFAEAESLYFKTLAIFTDRLGEQHPNTRSAFNGLVNLIAAAIQADQADTLSDHPMTQDLIPKIRTAMENQDE